MKRLILSVLILACLLMAGCPDEHVAGPVKPGQQPTNTYDNGSH